MKYIGYWEYDPKDIYKMFEINNRRAEKAKKNPEKWAEENGKAFGAYFMGEGPKGFTLYEFDNHEQIINVKAAYWPIKKWTFIPIFEHTKVIEIFEKRKKQS